MEVVGRPETITCARCGTSVTVKAKGPVPAFCSQCRGRGKRTRPARPETVACERCAEPISVGARGPLPRFCRGGCKQPARATLVRVPPETPADEGWVGSLPAAPIEQTARREVPEESTARQAAPPIAVPPSKPDRPAPAPPTTRPAGPTPRPEPETPAARARASATAVLTRPTDAVFDERALARGRRRSQIRRAATIAAWVLVVLLLVSIVMLGSRPSPPDFESLAGYLT